MNPKPEGTVKFGSSSGIRQLLGHHVAPMAHVDLDRLADEVAMALPQLDSEQRRVALAIYKLIGAGIPASPERIAALTRISSKDIGTLLEHLPTAAIEGGVVTAFLGLQRDPGTHRLLVWDQAVFTWCAFDALFLPELVGRTGRAESRCPVTGGDVLVEVDPLLGVTTSKPEGAMLSFLAHPAPFAGDVIVGFCRWVHFLSGPEAAKAWLEDESLPERPEAIVLSLDEGVELGHRTNKLVFGIEDQGALGFDREMGEP